MSLGERVNGSNSLKPAISIPGKRATLFGRASTIMIGLRMLIWKDVFYGRQIVSIFFFFFELYYVVLYT